MACRSFFGYNNTNNNICPSISAGDAPKKTLLWIPSLPCSFFLQHIPFRLARSRQNGEEKETTTHIIKIFFFLFMRFSPPQISVPRIFQLIAMCVGFGLSCKVEVDGLTEESPLSSHYTTLVPLCFDGLKFSLNRKKSETPRLVLLFL